ncbi:uncharacterized protein B0H18DRAFT_310528 [Fomitopsis serialis]|uniref:uncharacterized protein n=1 Tax=Fomitopsis serialis TaxID=139415 RepID=UPI002007D3E9|nr:uncharacterized protein B0H18DRAFT_310528 [Neoantrodia serialis]KAH9911741.1 hypothetical protein B0H18DRAFT_310528 [Neoantrodia serialis]
MSTAILTADVDHPMANIHTVQVANGPVTNPVANIAQAPAMWRHNEGVNAVLHASNCGVCDAFLHHATDALGTRNYQVARTEQDDTAARSARREAYERGYEDAQQDRATLATTIQQLQARIAELEGQLATRANTGGRFPGGGGLGPIRNRFAPYNTDSSVDTYLDNSLTRRFNTNERIRGPARHQTLIMSEVPLTIDEVDGALRRAQIDDAVGLAAVRQLQQWRRAIFATLAVGRPLSVTQEALQNHWVGLPDWYLHRFPRTPRLDRTTNPPTQEQHETPPRYTDPAEKWASYFSRYPRARLPRGLVRDNSGQVPIDRANLHCMMIRIASPLTSTRRRYKSAIFDTLAALFTDPQVYVAHLQAANVNPE